MIYLDSCILIYALEDTGPRGGRVRAALRDTTKTLVASPLVLHECLVRPFRDGDAESRRRVTEVYDQLMHIEVGRDVYVEAALLRAQFGLKAPDALHLAAAQSAGCEALWTNDKRLAAASHGLAVDVIGD